MMGRRSRLFVLMPILLLVIAACAPDDLDITPTAVPTPIPMITVYVTGAVAQPGTMVEIPQGSRVADAIEAAGGASDEANLQAINLAANVRDGDQIHVPAQGETAPEATEAAAGDDAEADAPPAEGGRATLDRLIDNLPSTFEAGPIVWQRDTNIDVAYIERPDGVTGRVSYGERGGGLMEITFGIFDSPEAALGYFETRVRSLESQSRTEERDILPTPNAFGSGTYGNASIFVVDNLAVYVAIPRFSSTAGDPLTPMSGHIVNYLRETLGLDI